MSLVNEDANRYSSTSYQYMHSVISNEFDLPIQIMLA